LLVAAIYQESRFNPEAVSETQVRGIMQLTTATARMLEVDRKKPEECILGGARYLRDLFDRVGDKAANDWDRWFMALAAYNQGMSNLNRAIRMAQDAGGKGNTWSELKRTFPLSTTCRGVEARSFVEKIRYYHFILHGLVALAPLKTQDFAPLHSLALSERSF
jgi:membrane-bound lytic murein transglycosylase F